MKMRIIISFIWHSADSYISEKISFFYSFPEIEFRSNISKMCIKNDISISHFKPYLISSKNIEIFCFCSVREIFSALDSIEIRPRKIIHNSNNNSVFHCLCDVANRCIYIPSVMNSISNISTKRTASIRELTRSCWHTFSFYRNDV